ncbi:uncharacterized protein N7473_005375 [Penicillium subrubescens]|uniref:PXMP2/4 family protein 3 n=1 Tax=Penicillium subrubescens TaxID=1316194 RepID=A0A1Q5UM11_9EURO|nr:uncharacterized protein N7473_005375 [Penicillium subrubescens]KAJ5895976.1 hypothetical protein N7473_005375 [Penicillium subrubescens]OKP13483.1 hypothetical protein PENSUB_674 [Penicillium subrubescens]
MSVPPIAKATLQATVINAGANVLAQAIKAYRNDIPFELDTQALMQFTTCGLITTPLNYIWQNNLEATFPGTRPQDAASKHEIKTGQPDPATSKPALNVTNTVTKIVIDQIIGATWNTVLFILTMGLLRGQHHEVVLTQIREEFWPIMIAGFKLWPFVSVLNFTVVPVDQRLLVASLFGVVWAVYLSLMSG